MKKCIICGIDNDAKSIEHIVSESLGNTHYIMERSTVCDNCNARFAKFEGKALSQSILLMERARLGIRSKKGKNAKGDIGGLNIRGDDSFEKNRISIKSEIDFIRNFDPKSKTAEITIPSFGNSSIPTSKLLLKMGIESLYKSRRDIYDKYNFQEAKDYLLAKSNIDWPIVTSEYELVKFNHIPRFNDKYRFGLLECSLMYCELDGQSLLFKFKYGGIPLEINLLNRNLDWISGVLDIDILAVLYPEHYRRDKKRNL